MILNLNITGKETKEQLVTISQEITQQMADDAEDTQNGKVLENTWIVYSMVACNLQASYAVNRSFNAVKEVNETLLKEEIAKTLEQVFGFQTMLANEFMGQLVSGKAQMKQLNV